MKTSFAICTMVAVTMVAAAPDPLITPGAELAARQDDPALLGWVNSVDGQFSDRRSCDFPATISSSGNLAQCCASSSCIFWSRCSAGTLFAAQTSQFCDQGYCNTAVIVPTVGASNGMNYLGCWATSLGQDAFTIVRDIGSAPIVAPTPTTSAPSSANTTGVISRPTSVRSSAAVPVQSSGAAVSSTVTPLTGVFGLVAMLVSML